MPDLDPTHLKDWQIAEAAESGMKTVSQLGSELGLREEELLPYGRYIGKVDFAAILRRLNDRPNGKYIDVTAITPTPLGEGKSTTVIGLVQGLGRLGKRVLGAIRQPSGGPMFNIKGSAAGGGLSQVLPLTEFSLGLTGDIDAITNAHNLAMVALTSRMQHEFNYADAVLDRKGLRRLDIDPRNVAVGWAMDLCAQALREVILGIGSKMDGFLMQSGFQITVSSELMAILAVATNLADLRERIGRMVVAYDKVGTPVTTADLEVDGAMTALMSRTINPNIVQTIEGQVMLVHAGPFANIAIGQSSVIADRVGLKLGEYHVTESGFGADIGFEKFWNLKCRYSGLRPDCAVIVATIRALKMHGGGPEVAPGRPLNEAYTEENLPLLESGIENLLAHIDIVRQSGTTPVVCINHFSTDTDAEVALVRRVAEEAGVRAAVSRHWQAGGEGARELAEAVVDACNEPSSFRFLYDPDLALREKVARIAERIYGADAVLYLPRSEVDLAQIEDDTSLADFGVCMAKTHLSLSHDPSLKGRPEGWRLPIREMLVYRGAGFIVPVAGDIKLMPGTASDAAFRRIDVDTESGRVTGLF
ncbi:MAG TPA: formate--tetrahydrofolate ligase [Candidatus Hydrogenedentes bacterium]|nr:formate--tetrahydrofolate ligase [Candidatus Hydrogenedentota bacterium]HPG65858.1 formate--tetrahydrofolate ligase [Candidatus Hydrogenedentota bacterium]